MKVRNTKKALLSSALCLLLCFAMLIGSTFAWFTDRVEVTGNRIVAGNLDVEMFYKNASVTDWANVNTVSEDEPKFFLDVNGQDIKWEPGAVAYATFKVENVGSLALKYALETVADNFNTVAGTDKSLKDVLTVAVPTTVDTSSREVLIASIEDATAFESFGFDGKVLEEGKYDEFTVVIYWAPSAVDNDYNLKDGKTSSDGEPLWINLDFILSATQATVENDSIDNQYDKNATYPLIDSKEFATAIKNAKDKTFVLGNGTYTLPSFTNKNANLVFKGDEGTKISGMTGKSTGFYAFTFDNIEFTGDIKGTFYSGESTIKNCTFTDAGLTPSCNVNFTGILTIDNCEFTVTDMDAATIHFGGKDGGTVIVKNSKISGGWMAFGKGMNITFENCEFTDGARYSGYGPATFTGCTFSADSEVYIHAGTGATDVTITMNGCEAEGGADVKTVCYDTGNSNGGVKQFVIDGVTYNHDQMQAY